MVRVVWYLGLVGLCWVAANCARDVVAPEVVGVAELKGRVLEEYKVRLAERTLVKRSQQDRDGLGFPAGGGILPPIPGTWRPFSDNDAFWNKKIADLSFVETWFEHRHSDLIIAEASKPSRNNGRVSFSGSFNIPIWHIDSTQLPLRTAHSSSNIYHEWDATGNDCSDVGVPYENAMWPEPNSDGHICIVDTALNKSWEMSKFKSTCTLSNHCSANDVQCSTFNIWDLTAVGYHTPLWTEFEHGATSRGGRGGGTPEIGGIIRPEEILAGEIRHAMGFTYDGIKGTSRDSDWHLFAYPPCVRADEPANVANQTGDQYMTYGLRIQLNPNLPDSYFAGLGITSQNVMVVVRCLQEYGAYLHDYGGPEGTGHIKFARQMLSQNGQTADENMWKSALNNDNAFFTQFNFLKASDFIVLQWANQREILWNHDTGEVEVVYQPADGPS